jgi:hypothetical protein
MPRCGTTFYGNPLPGRGKRQRRWGGLWVHRGLPTPVALRHPPLRRRGYSQKRTPSS